MGLVLIPQPSFLGTGLAFPFQLDASNSRPLIASEEDLVIMGMKQLVTTVIGERPFLVKNGTPFGTMITQSIFENEDVARDIIVFETKRALEVWEPRIIVRATDITKIEDGHGGVSLVATTTFTFRATSRTDNFVIPYLLRSPI